MQSTLGLTALLMGLMGGPHCIAMCGAACAGISQGARGGTTLGLLLFQVGRVMGYALLGALAAASMQGMGWLTVQSAALRPVWSLFHVAAIVLGLILLVKARQPIWLERAGQGLWRRARALGASTAAAPLVLGVLWALLPCGLLYSAVLVAALAGGVWAGAGVMALFALGTSLTMTLGPLIWLRLRAGRTSDGAWGIRLAGAALAGSSAWALWMALAHDQAPWCVTP